MSDAPKDPKGVVAVLVSADGSEIANAAAFNREAPPAGFSRRSYQEDLARRALALATIDTLASKRLADAIDAYMAEQILRTLCKQGCRVIVLHIGYDE